MTKDDLKTLKDAGVEHLRVPVGYWLMGQEYIKEDETYLPGGYPYLLRLLGWCKELGLKAIIDLHGAAGSQNGHDNSGFQGGNAAIKWDTPENLQRTTDVLVAMAKNFTEVNKQAAYKDSVLGLCILNEPWTERVMGTVKMDTLKEWVQDATDAIIAAGWEGACVGLCFLWGLGVGLNLNLSWNGSGCVLGGSRRLTTSTTLIKPSTGDIWFPDGFDLTWEGWEGFLQPPKYQNVYIDTHFYLLFDPNLWQSNPQELTNYVCQVRYHWWRGVCVCVYRRSIDPPSLLVYHIHTYPHIPPPRTRAGPPRSWTRSRGRWPPAWWWASTPSTSGSTRSTPTPRSSSRPSRTSSSRSRRCDDE